MFNPIEFAAVDNRFPVYKKFRDETPVLPTQFGSVSMALLTRYDDVSSILRDPTVRVKPLPGQPNPAGLDDGPAKTVFDALLVLSDSPQHERLRRLVSPAFALPKLKPLQEWMQEMVDTRIATLAERESFDLVQDLATYVPAQVILRILGIPFADWESLTSRLADFLNIFVSFPLRPEELKRCNDACAFYQDYFDALVHDRQSAPGDDIVGTMISAQDNGDRLSRAELLSMLQAFLTAGLETTTSTLGAGMWGLLSQRTPWRQLVADPLLAPQALEEILRWEAPIAFLRRYLTKDTVLHGVELKAGEPVLLGLASANRDERKFDQPDTIDIHRKGKEHVSFGGGHHFCIGNQLARMEARMTIQSLARHLPDLELVDEPHVRQESLAFHSFQSIRVTPGKLRSRPS